MSDRLCASSHALDTFLSAMLRPLLLFVSFRFVFSVKRDDDELEINIHITRVCVCARA